MAANNNSKKTISGIFAKIEQQVKGLSRSEKIDIGQAAIDEMKRMISVGQSPIEGRGRFPGYAAERIGAIGKSKKFKKSSKYPDSARKKYPAKRRRPVNLVLSGAQLRALAVVLDGDKIQVGYPEGRGRSPGSLADAATKEKGHREGVNKQPPRPTIPKEGERFAQRIHVKVSQRVAEIIFARLKRLGSKS